MGNISSEINPHSWKIQSTIPTKYPETKNGISERKNLPVNQDTQSDDSICKSYVCIYINK